MTNKETAEQNLRALADGRTLERDNGYIRLLDKNGCICDHADNPGSLSDVGAYHIMPVYPELPHRYKSYTVPYKKEADLAHYVGDLRKAYDELIDYVEWLSKQIKSDK